MSSKTQAEAYSENESSKILPAGYTKILNAFRDLISEKDFFTITWAEIAKTAGVNEALIYKYFKDKRGLLHQAMAEGLKHFISHLELYLKDVDGALNKIRKLIWYHINAYNKNRIFARIQMIEVNSYQEYFQSDAYELAKEYGKIILRIIEEGMKNGEIR
ncbi:MAG: TetR/AcrR family transcriptional regulator, partial [Deltaproteobacteria bacterium]|nr:TetR/AcrR family transcriptional regulator [Deltaproteobacteria bacterium]